MSRRDEYVERMKQQLDELNAQIDELEKKADKSQADMKAKYREQVQELRELSAAARKKLDELRASGEHRWDLLMAEAEKVQKAFIHSFNYFKSQLK